MVSMMRLAGVMVISWAICPLAQSSVVSVERFGALPDDGQLDTAAIQAAADLCCRESGSRLVFPPGRYDLAQSSDPKHGNASIVFEGGQDLRIEGDQAVLVFHGLTSPFVFRNCRNVRIQGLLIDWARPPFSVGRVTGVGEKSFDVSVWEQFPVSGGEPVQAFMDYDVNSALPRRHGLDVYGGVQRTERMGPQQLRLHCDRKLPIQKDTWAVLRHQVYGYNAFTLKRCSDVGFTDVTIYTAPGMGLYAEKTRNVSLERFRVVVKPGSRRLMSTTADATHFKACKGMIQMKDCVFEGMGDDATNVGVLYLTVKERLDDRSVLAAHNLRIPSCPDVGDQMDFISHETLLPYAKSVVESTDFDDQRVASRITFRDPLPERLKDGDVLGNVSCTPRVRIRGCRVGNNRARGFLLQTRDAVVENCTFENCTSGGVWVITEIVYFFEGVGARDVVIRNNVFENCNYGGPIGEGVLSVFAYLKGFKFPPRPGVHRNVVLEGNRIRGADNCGVFITCSDGVVIRNNDIEQVCLKPTRDEGKSAVYIMSSRDIELAGNRVLRNRQGDACESVFRLGPGCSEETVRVQGNRGF